MPGCTRVAASLLLLGALLAGCGSRVPPAAPTSPQAAVGEQLPGGSEEARTGPTEPAASDDGGGAAAVDASAAQTPQAPPSEVATSDVELAPVTEVVPYRVELRTSDAATADFPRTLHAVLTDPRGWVRAGFVFEHRDDAPYRIVLAEGPEVDALCAPLETWSTYSCQNGPVVALNADRWRSATPEWTGDLESYRVMLVNHEVGHLLHLHHPTRQCPGPGLPAPIMSQQSTELGECLPNPWPLQWEIDLVAERREPLAPPADHDTSDHRPDPPQVRH
jgi:hypothetical protein